MAPKDVKSIIDRKRKAVAQRPSFGQGTATTRVTVRGGSIACDIEDGPWKLVGDESPGDGGEGLGPDPGVFGRAALGSCLAIGYAMWAKYLEVPVDNIEVLVEADYDARGILGVDDSVSPGWQAMRYIVNIRSPAPEEAVRQMVEHADKHSSLLDAFLRAVPVSADIRINSTASAPVGAGGEGSS